MWAATTSATETIFVRLLGEGVDVWRPVAATSLGNDLFRLSDATVPADEEREFGPGEVVAGRLRDGAEGPFLAALATPKHGVRRAG